MYFGCIFKADFLLLSHFHKSVWCDIEIKKRKFDDNKSLHSYIRKKLQTFIIKAMTIDMYNFLMQYNFRI